MSELAKVLDLEPSTLRQHKYKPTNSNSRQPLDEFITQLTLHTCWLHGGGSILDSVTCSTCMAACIHFKMIEYNREVCFSNWYHAQKVVIKLKMILALFGTKTVSGAKTTLGVHTWGTCQ